MSSGSEIINHDLNPLDYDDKNCLCLRISFQKLQKKQFECKSNCEKIKQEIFS